MNNVVGQIVTVFTAIIGIAILAVLVSKKAQTPEVIKAAFGGLGYAINAATSPVTGGGGNFQL